MSENKQEDSFYKILDHVATIFWMDDLQEQDESVLNTLKQIFGLLFDTRGNTSESPEFARLIHILASRLEKYRHENGGTSYNECWLMLYGTATFLASQNKDSTNRNAGEMLAEEIARIYSNVDDTETALITRKSLTALSRLLSSNFQPSPFNSGEEIPEVDDVHDIIRDLGNVSDNEAMFFFTAINTLITNLNKTPETKNKL